MKRRHLKTIGLFAGIFFVVILASPTTISIFFGSSLVCIGEMIRIWAAGHLRRKKELTTSGPYTYIRDPLYLGRLFLIIGFCVMGWGYSLIMLPVALGIFFLNYLPRKYRKEMAWLENLFGEEYIRYAACVRSLIPGFRPYKQARQRKWSFDIFRHENREQYFLLIVLFVWAAFFYRYTGFP